MTTDDMNLNVDFGEVMLVTSLEIGETVGTAFEGSRGVALETKTAELEGKVDGKVDKVTTSQILYGTNYHGEPATWKFGGDATAYTLMYRSGDGTSSIADPIEPLDITNKQWVETGLDGKVSKYTGTPNTYSKIYGQEANTGNEKVFNASGSPVYNDVAMYGYTSEGGYNSAGELVKYQTGAVSTGIPLQPAHATPKRWVEDNFTVYKHLIQLNMGEGAIPHVFNVLSTRSTPYTNASELPKNETFTIVDDAFEQIQFVRIYGDNVYGIQYDYYGSMWSYISSTISSFFGIESDTVIKA